MEEGGRSLQTRASVLSEIMDSDAENSGGGGGEGVEEVGGKGGEGVGPGGPQRTEREKKIDVCFPQVSW